MAIDTGVVADDLTGGVLVAGFLEAEGIRCPVVLSSEAVAEAADSPALLVARRLRLAPAAAAVADFEAAAKALADQGARQIYYKYCATFDSTDDGNIGPCSDALMRLRGADRLGFCPAFPGVGITVYQGHMFLRGELLSESPKRLDPVTPMLDPNLVQVLGRQTERRVSLVSHQILRAGEAAAQAHIDALVADGTPYLVFDAIDDADVATCARLTTGWPAMTGADTLSHMGPVLRIKERAPARVLPNATGLAAAISGSCGPATLEQLDRFGVHHPVRRIDLVEAADDPGTAVDEALGWAAGRLSDGPIAVAISDHPEGVARTQAVLGREGAARLGETICGDLAKGLFSLGVRRFVIAGGETSGAVAEALGISRLDVAAPGAIGGGFCYAATPAPMSLMFKAGKMGASDLFLRAFEAMGATDA
ncbi:MAG TPA: four-carbon acid sugar kinase family protein [Thermohalobaculum sp.]|nr:four-carbon acid sugar kinase family protein [Thermohalobaculum sp.]